MAVSKDHAVVLRLMDWSETSQIAVLLTREHGKISAVAKGAKRQQPSMMARFSGGLELLSAGEAVWIAKRSAELVQLTDWDLLDPHWHLRRDLHAYRLAMFAVDLVHHIVQDHDPHRRTFDELRRFLQNLAHGADHARALLAFQWAVVVDMGLRPQLDHDAHTGHVVDEQGDTMAFSAHAGGIVTDTGAGDRWRVRRSTIDLLRRLAADADISACEAQVLERANRLLCTYFRAILDRHLPTMAPILDEG